MPPPLAPRVLGWPTAVPPMLQLLSVSEPLLGLGTPAIDPTAGLGWVAVTVDIAVGQSQRAAVEHTGAVVGTGHPLPLAIVRSVIVAVIRSEY